MTRAIAIALALAIASLAAPSALDAQEGEAAPAPPDPSPEVETARRLFEEGSVLATARDWAGAAERFASSASLAERSSTMFNLGVCLYALERWRETVSALERFAALADPIADADDLRAAAQMLGHARGRLVHLVIDVAPSDASVSVDGAVVGGDAERSVTLDAGVHALRVEAPGHETVLRELTLESGSAREIVAMVRTLQPPSLSLRVPEGALVRIDDEPRSLSSDGAPLVLEPGPHTVRVELAGHVPLERALTLAPGETRGLDVALAPAPAAWWEDGWLWAAVGAGLAAAGVGLGVGVAAIDPGSAAPPGGSVGVVLRTLGGP